jgi:hypothetical protein
MMVKHIVLWRLKDSALGNPRSANARIIKERLEALQGIVPGLLKAEVGIDFSKAEQSFDVVLYSEFDSRESLRGYQDHPAHQSVVSFIREVREDRCVVDYEL